MEHTYHHVITKCRLTITKLSQIYVVRLWRIAESALEEALHKGLDLRGLTKRPGKKRPQPEALKRAQQDKRKMSKHSA